MNEETRCKAEDPQHFAQHQISKTVEYEPHKINFSNEPEFACQATTSQMMSSFNRKNFIEKENSLRSSCECKTN